MAGQGRLTGRGAGGRGGRWGGGVRAGPPDTRVASTRAAPSRACAACPGGAQREAGLGTVMRAAAATAGGARGSPEPGPPPPPPSPAPPRYPQPRRRGRVVSAVAGPRQRAGGWRPGCPLRPGQAGAAWAADPGRAPGKRFGPRPTSPKQDAPRRQQRWVLLCSASEMGRPAATVKPGCHQTVASPGSRPGRGWGGPTATRPGPAQGTGFQPQNRCTPFPALVTARGHWDPPSPTHQDSPTHRDAPTTPAVWAQPRGFPSGPWGPHPAAPGHGLGWRACCRLLGSACRIRVGLQAALPTRLVSTVDTAPPPPICPAPRPGRGRPPASTMWGRRAWCLHTPKTDLDPGDSWLKSPLSLNV